MSDKPAEVVFGREALKDRRRIPEERVEEIASRLQMIASGRTRNLDIKALQGVKPWLRLPVGDYRVVYRRSGNRSWSLEWGHTRSWNPPSES